MALFSMKHSSKKSSPKTHFPKAYSLKSYLLKCLLSLTMAAFVMAMLVTAMKALKEMNEVFDTEMSTQLQTLAQLYQPKVGQAVEIIEIANPETWVLPNTTESSEEGWFSEQGEAHENAAKRMAFLVLNPDRQVVMRTDNSPVLALTVLQQGFSVQGEWRVLASRHPDNGFWYLVMQADRHRWEVGAEVVLQMVWPLLLSLPLLAFLIYFAVGKMMKDIYVLQNHLAERHESDLSLLDGSCVPTELQPFVQEINHLLHRISLLIGKEKQFISDAAHEMKTPLSILKIHVNNLSQATNEIERQDSLQKLVRGIDRTSHLTRQLLTLAKVEDLPAQVLGSCPMIPLCQQLVADLYPMAMKKQQELMLNGIEQIQISADPELMRIMLENLVTNALRYSPEKGAVEINLQQQGDELRIEVFDDGEGIPVEQQHTIFERFNRGNQVSSEGSGLGLAIVKRIAELHGFSLQLIARQGNQRACCRLVAKLT